MDDHNIIASIRLARSVGIGAIRYKKLLKEYGSAQAALEAWEKNPDLLGKKATLYALDDAQKEYSEGTKKGGVCLPYESPSYPEILKNIYDPPPILWCLGNISLMGKTACAIVGSRNASIGGRKIAVSLAKKLGTQGYIVISGLARGIDLAAHEGSLKTGTIAILASGIHEIYPPEHHHLTQNILDHNGLILSENPPLQKPKANLFPKRNRIISGLSSAVAIIEAGMQSGSLSTANYALDQHKEIFAVPGSPLDPRAAGPNKLLRNGANWLESSDDVLQYLDQITLEPASEKHNQIKINMAQTLKIAIKEPQKIPSQSISIEDDFLSLFGQSPISSDEIIRMTQKTPNTILELLTFHELSGDIERIHGNFFQKIPKK